MTAIDVGAKYTYDVRGDGKIYASMSSDRRPAETVYLDAPLDDENPHVLLAVEDENTAMTMWIPLEDIPTLINELEAYTDE